MNKRTIYYICITISIIAIIGIIRFSFAYFQVPISGIGTTSELTSERLVLSFNDSESSMNITDIFPGDSFTKTLEITNISNKNAITYDLVWESINNTFLYNEIHFAATCVSYTEYGTLNQQVAGTCKDILEQPAGNSTAIPVTSGIVINKGYTHVYTVTITFIETEEPQEYNKGKVFSGVLGVQGKGQIVASSDCTHSDTSLKCTIINNNTAVVDSAIDFSQISSDNNGNGLYYTNDLSKNEDNKGVYYFRGAVENNYMIFAGFCWRIVRTNEDGSVKIRYNGTPTEGTCSQTGTNVSIGSSAFHYMSNDNAYIGLVHGSIDTFNLSTLSATANFNGTTPYLFSSSTTLTNNKYQLNGANTVISSWNSAITCNSDSCPVMDHYTCFDNFSSATCETLFQIKGYVSSTKASVIMTIKSSTSYAQAHGEGENSTIKSLLDTWYVDNISNQGDTVTSKIADTTYCNDRSLFSGIGYGYNSTYYYGYHRITNNKSPQYKCNNANDKFSVSNNNGNTLLSNPVSLLTADEVAYAGGLYDTTNTTYYLYTASDYWTMTPSDHTNSISYNYVQSSNGSLVNNKRVGTSTSVLPVISLLPAANVTSGNGSYNTPYIVE